MATSLPRQMSQAPFENRVPEVKVTGRFLPWRCGLNNAKMGIPQQGSVAAEDWVAWPIANVAPNMLWASTIHNSVGDSHKKQHMCAVSRTFILPIVAHHKTCRNASDPRTVSPRLHCIGGWDVESNNARPLAAFALPAPPPPLLHRRAIEAKGCPESKLCGQASTPSVAKRSGCVRTRSDPLADAACTQR